MCCHTVQWSLYFKTTHGTKEMWSYIAGGLKTSLIAHKITFWDKILWSYNQGGLEINGCKIEGVLDMNCHPQPELTLYTGIVHCQGQTPCDSTGLWFLEPLSLDFTIQPVPITV